MNKQQVEAIAKYASDLQISIHWNKAGASNQEAGGEPERAAISRRIAEESETQLRTVFDLTNILGITDRVKDQM